MIDLPDLPEFEWPLHEMLFYRSLGTGGKYLVCARGPRSKSEYGTEIIRIGEFDTYYAANNYLDEIARLQALTMALLR